MVRINQGYGGPVTTCTTDGKYSSASLASDGSLGIPRTDRASWWNQDNGQFSVAYNADLGVTVDGSSYVTQWVDQARSAYIMNQVSGYESTVSLAPTGWSDGTPAIQFVDGQLSMTQAAQHMMYGFTRTLVLHCRFTSLTGANGIATVWGSGVAQQFYTASAKVQIQSSITPDSELTLGRDTLLFMSVRNSEYGSRVLVNGKSIVFQPNNMVNVSSISGARFGARVNSGGATLASARMLVKNFAISDEELTERDYRWLSVKLLGSEYAQVFLSGSQIAASASMEVHLNTVLNWSKGAGATSRANSGNGYTTIGCIGRLATTEVPLMVASGRNIIVFTEGGNDIANMSITSLVEARAAARVVLDGIRRYCIEAKAQAAAVGKSTEVIVLHVLRRLSFTTYQTACVDLLNQALTDEWPQFAEGLVELAKVDALLNGQGVGGYYSDGTTLGALGLDIVANMVGSEVLRVLHTRRVTL